MTPLHLLPPLLTTPLMPAPKTPPTPSPTALRSLTPQLSAPPWPMASTQLMASMVLTVMASAANMSGGHLLPMGVQEGTAASGSGPQISWLMIASGTIVCCCGCYCFGCISAAAHAMHRGRDAHVVISSMCTRLCFLCGLCRQPLLLSGLLGSCCTFSMCTLKVWGHEEASQCTHQSLSEPLQLCWACRHSVPLDTCASMLHEQRGPNALLAAAVSFAWHAALLLKPILASFAVIILSLIWNNLFTWMYSRAGSVMGA